MEAFNTTPGRTLVVVVDRKTTLNHKVPVNEVARCSEISLNESYFAKIAEKAVPSMNRAFEVKSRTFILNGKSQNRSGYVSVLDTDALTSAMNFFDLSIWRKLRALRARRCPPWTYCRHCKPS